MDARCLVVGALLCVVVACQPFPPEEETPAAALIPPTEAVPPTAPPAATNTPDFSQPAPPVDTSYEPRVVGDQRIGLEISIPTSWTDVSDLLAASPVLTSPEAEVLFLTDDKQTGNRLVTGKPVGAGAFVIAFVPHENRPVADPIVALGNLIAGGDPIDDPRQRIQPVIVDQVQGAYVDLDYEPLAWFPAGDTPLRVRMLLLVQPVTNEPLIFQFGTTGDSWPDYNPLFAEMINTIVVHAVLAENIPGRATPPARLGNLISGDLAEGILGDEATHIWNFDAEAGTFATLTLIPQAADLDLTLTLVTPAGETMSQVDFGYSGDTETLADIPLPETGRYEVLVREFFGAPGEYKLGLVLTNDPQFGSGGNLLVGQVIMGELPTNGEQIWSFPGTAGQMISIILSPTDDSFDAVLELRDPAGRVLVSLDEGFSGDAEVMAGRLLETTGNYRIHVRGFDGSGGSYTLSLAEGGDETANFYDAGDLLYGDVKRETLRANEAHAWFFEGLAGDEINIVVTPRDSSLDMHIWLLDPAVERLAEKDDFLGGRAEIIHHTLPSDGQFIVLVREFFGKPGSYEIALTYSGNNSLAYGGDLAYGEEVTGTLSPGRGVVWSFNGLAGEVVSLALTPEDNSDVLFLLRSPGGNIVLTVSETIDGEAEQLDNFTLPAGGTWTIVVREYFSAGSHYRLLLEVADPP